MAEYSRMAQGSFVAQGAAASAATAYVNLPFQPDYVELWNYTNIKTAPAANKVTRAWWDSKFIDTVANSNPTMIELYPSGSTTFTAFDTIQTNGISSFSAGQLLQFGPTYQHTGSTDFSITKASAAAVTTTTNHLLNSGDVIIFEGLFQTSTTGMPQLNYVPFTVTVTSSTGFTIPWDTTGSNYTAFNTATSTGNVGSWKKVLYPYLYFPGQSIISNIVLGATTTVSTSDAHNLRVGQEVAFRIPQVSGAPGSWGPTQLNSLPNLLTPGSPVYGYVTSVTDYHTVVVNINSTAYTIWSNNIPVSSVPGLSYAQIVAVGDVNTGGEAITSTSPLYPSPMYQPIGTTQYPTINGPAIRGAFVNNTSMGFVINAGPGNTNASANLITTGDLVIWHAYMHDYNNPS